MRGLGAAVARQREPQADDGMGFLPVVAALAPMVGKLGKKKRSRAAATPPASAGPSPLAIGAAVALGLVAIVAGVMYARRA
jgi:hypothetical protein